MPEHIHLHARVKSRNDEQEEGTAGAEPSLDRVVTIVDAHAELLAEHILALHRVADLAAGTLLRPRCSFPTRIVDTSLSNHI